MEEENLVVGVDIGTSKICAVAGFLQNDGAIKLKGFVEKSIAPEDEVLRNGEIENAQRTIEILDGVLEELAENLKINLVSININISSPDIFGIYHKGKITKSGDNKQIQQNDVDRLIEDVRLSFKATPGRVVLHTLPQDFYVNDVKAGEKVVGKFGVQIGGDFYFITGKTESLENLYYTIKNVSAKTEGKKKNPLSIDNVILSGIADSLVLLDSKIDDKRNGVAIVNIGADLTDLSIFHKNGIRYYKSIPIGGNAITHDLMEAFNINFEDAEILKKIAGNIPSKSINDTEAVIINRQQGLAPIEILLKNASLVVEWRIKEIAAIIKTEIVRAGYDNTLTNGIILTGGTSSMTIIKDIFIDITKIKSVRRAKINDKINEKINFNGMDYLNKPKYTTLMGLLRVAYIPYDSRVDNRVLLHTHTKPSPIEIVVPEKKQPEPKKIGLLEKIKNIMRDDDSMNDDYSKN